MHINDAAEAEVVNFFALAPRGLTIFLVNPASPGFRVLEKTSLIR